MFSASAKEILSPKVNGPVKVSYLHTSYISLETSYIATHTHIAAYAYIYVLALCIISKQYYIYIYTHVYVRFVVQMFV